MTVDIGTRSSMGAACSPVRIRASEAAVAAANAWYDEMTAVIGGGASCPQDWQAVIPQAAEKAELMGRP